MGTRSRAWLLLMAVVFLGLTAALGGCAKESTDDTGEATGGVDAVTEDCEKVLDLSTGTALSVSLSEGDRVALLVETNATIPYADVLMEKPDGLTFVEMREVLPETGEQPVAGAGYIAVWVFDATGPAGGLVRIQKWPLEDIQFDDASGLWSLTTGVDVAGGDGQMWELQVHIDE